MSPTIISSLAIVILLLPLASSLLLLAFGKRLPRQGDSIATGALFLALGLSFVVLAGTLTRTPGAPAPGFPSAPIQATFTWVDFHSTMAVLGQQIPLRIEMGIMVDNLVAIMLVVVTLISAVVPAARSRTNTS